MASIADSYMASHQSLDDFVLYGEESSFSDMLSHQKQMQMSEELIYNANMNQMFHQQQQQQQQQQQGFQPMPARNHQDSFDRFTVSSASANSVSTASNSPYLSTDQTVIPTSSEMWAPSIVHNAFDDLSWQTVSDDAVFATDKFVDPSLLQPMQHGPAFNNTFSLEQTLEFPQAPSPAPSNRSFSNRPGSANIKTGSSSPYLNTVNYQPYDASSRRQSMVSSASRHSSQDSTSSRRAESEEAKDEPKTGRAALCQQCGKTFQDIKAHKLTHLEERPEKCSIVTCEYHIKGFARKYDCQRHTLTHYKGTMVCGFCPNSGSAAEKSFNRADVFKRHLMSVHNVEQPPPNGRKRSSPSARANAAKEDVPAKCSICSASFTTAQAFYDHLDNCVLHKVGQEEPSERINAANMASVENDSFVVALTENHPVLPLSPPSSSGCDSSESDDETETGEVKKKKQAAKGTKGVFTWSAGGVSLQKGRANNAGKKKRTAMPPAWGLPAEKLTMKKRSLQVFSGDRRLWKDDMMLSNELEVRLDLADGAWCTDLDLRTLERSEALHGATEEEKGPYESRDMGWGAGNGIPEDQQKILEAEFGF